MTAAQNLHLAKRIVALALIVLAVSTLSAGSHARGLVAEKLAAQQIIMPGTPAIETQVENGILTEEDARELTRFAGQPMTNGLQAKAYADHYIAAQLRFLAHRLEVSDEDASYARLAILVSQYTEALRAELSALPENEGRTDAEIAAQVNREIATANSRYPNAQKAAALQNLRLETYFTGNVLQGLLLNAYGWWLLGSISTLVGLFCLAGGTTLLVFSFFPRAGRTSTRQADTRSAPLLL